MSKDNPMKIFYKDHELFIVKWSEDESTYYKAFKYYKEDKGIVEERFNEETLNNEGLSGRWFGVTLRTMITTDTNKAIFSLSFSKRFMEDCYFIFENRKALEEYIIDICREEAPTLKATISLD